MADYSKHQTRGSTWETERLIPDTVPWHKKRMIDEHRMRYEFATSYIKRKSVIDLACGTGYGCHMMAEAGAQGVTGIDNSAEAIAYATTDYQHPQCTYVQKDVTSTGLASQSADVITSFETVEHIPDDRAFITEVRRILKPSGIFIMSTPNVEFSIGTNPYHLREYTRAACEALLTDFSSTVCYGQRFVYRPLFNLMKHVPALASFRPWEPIGIKKLTKKTAADYCYFIFVCIR